MAVDITRLWQMLRLLFNSELGVPFDRFEAD